MNTITAHRAFEMAQVAAVPAKASPEHMRVAFDAIRRRADRGRVSIISDDLFGELPFDALNSAHKEIVYAELETLGYKIRKDKYNPTLISWASPVQTVGA